ncbi:MAG: extracellular solute-binding protein [Chloroflexi bacterium]|nr:extracellular solute-binding protein [Chloroflexota bacterium]
MKRSFLGILLLVLSLVAACTPKQTPAPPPATPAAPATPPSPFRESSAGTQAATAPQTSDWDKVIAAAKKEGRLNVYSFNMTGDAGVDVARGFQARYGIKLDIITGGGAALAERIKTEKRMGTTVADVMDANTFQTSHIKNIGGTVSAADLPALKEQGVWLVDPAANDPERHKLIHTVLYYSVVANAGMLKSGDEPKSVKELALPKWKGKISAYDARQSSGHYNYFLPLLKRKLIDLDTLQAIGKNDIGWAATSQDSAQNLIRGLYPLYVGGGTSPFAPLVATEPTLPVKLLDMPEGVVVYNLAIALIKDSPHPNAAKLLVNWMFTPEGQQTFVKAKGLVPVRKDVPDFTPGMLRMTPTKFIVPSAEEEDEYVKLFQEGYLAKLWGK